MDGKTTIKYLQSYIKSKDCHPERTPEYFMKLAEEVGELSRAMQKNARRTDRESIKGTIEEELWDVIYYAIAIANCYEIDLEEAIREKEAINRVKYASVVTFEPGR